MAFIRINRKLFDHIFWKENREFSRAEAWIDLIQLVSFMDNNKKIVDGVVISWDRGQYPISHQFLSQRWNWSIHRVRIFMDLLKSEQQITTIFTGKATILTLCNYDYYNPKSQTDGRVKAVDTAGDAAGDAAQINTNKSSRYSKKTQGDGRVTGRQTAGINNEEGKEDKSKEINKENFSDSKEGSKPNMFSEEDYANAPLYVQDNSFMDEPEYPKPPEEFEM